MAKKKNEFIPVKAYNGQGLYNMTRGAIKSDEEKRQEEAQKKLIAERQATRKANKEKGTSLARRTTNEAMEYNQKGYEGKSAVKGTTSYEWEKSILHDLPSKYGKSYNAKFDTWASKDLGLSKQEATEFRTWLDSKEDVIKTKKRSNQEGYKEIPIATKHSQLKDMLKNQDSSMKMFGDSVEWDTEEWEERKAKKAEQEAKVKSRQIRNENERDGVLGFLDSTLGRGARKAQDMAATALGMPNFVEEQDKAFRRTAEANKNEQSLKQLNRVTREADGALEKTSDIIGMGAGLAALALPYSQAYKAVGAAGNLARLTKGGSQAAEALSKSRLATEALRGSAAGATFGSANAAALEAIDPDAHSAADHAKRIGIETVFGGVGDVAIHGIGRGIKALTENTMSKMLPTDETTTRIITHALQGIERRSLSKQPLATSQFKGNISPTQAASQAASPTQAAGKFSALSRQPLAQSNYRGSIPPTNDLPTMNDDLLSTPLAKQLEQEFNDAVESQFQYLKQNMKKGTEGGTTTNQFGEITGTFTVSKNDGWYQEFYRQHNRPPNQKELRQLAEQHVKEGFVDNVGSIPAWRSPEIDSIDQQINDLMQVVKNQPEQTEAILPLIQALETDKEGILRIQNSLMGNVENITPPQTPSKGVNLNDRPLEGNLSHEAISPQKQAKEIESAYKDDIVLADGRKADMSKVRFNERMVRQSEMELAAAMQNNNADAIRVAQSKLNRYSKALDESVNAPRFQTADETKKGFDKLKNPKNRQEEAFEAIEPMTDPAPLIRVAERPPPVNENVKYKTGDPLPDTSSHIRSKTEKNLPSLKQLGNKAVIKMTDDLDPLKQFTNRLKESGKEVKAGDDPYTLALNSRGVDQTTYMIHTDNLIDKSGKVIMREDGVTPMGSFESVVKQVGKGKKVLREFEDYLINRHAIYRQEQGQHVFPKEWEMNAAKSADIAKNLEVQNPEFKRIAEELYEWDRAFKKAWLVDGEDSLMSESAFKAMTSQQPDYIPNQRIFEKHEKGGGGGANSGFSGQNSTIKEVNKVGSERAIQSPIEAFITQQDQIVKAARRNEVMTTVVKHVNENKELLKDIVEVVENPKGKEVVANDLNVDETDLESFIESFNSAWEVRNKPDLTRGNIVRAKVKGEDVYLKVHDPDFLDSLTTLDTNGRDVIVNMAAKITQTMKTLTTGMNVVFNFTRNLQADIPDAYAKSKTVDNPAKFAKDYAAAIVSMIKKDEFYKTYKRVGGGHASNVSQNINLLDDAMNRITRKKSPKALAKRGLTFIERVNNLAETPPRLAEFKRLAKQDDSYSGLQKALYEANDITTNFKKRGEWTRQADAFFPYITAAVQGINKTYRSFKDNPVKAPVKAAVGLTIPTMVLYAINHDDPDYQEVSNRVKDDYFLIPNGDGTFTRIRKARELGATFSAPVERALRQFAKDDPQAWEDFANTIKMTFGLPLDRSIFAPFSDVKANENYFGSPIVPSDLKDLPPELQYDDNTTILAKGLSKVTGVLPVKKDLKSPKNLDYLMRQYTGVLGELGQPLMTEKGSVGDTLIKKVTVDPTFTNDHSKRWYDLKEKLKEANAIKDKKDIENDNYDPDLLKLMNKREKEIREIRNEIEEVESSKQSKESKQKDIRRLRKQINRLYDVSDL